MAKKKKYYAVAKGRKTGILETWEECQAAVIGVAGAKYKSFLTREEAQAYLDERSDNDETAESLVQERSQR